MLNYKDNVFSNEDFQVSNGLKTRYELAQKDNPLLIALTFSSLSMHSESFKSLHYICILANDFKTMAP